MNIVPPIQRSSYIAMIESIVARGIPFVPASERFECVPIELATNTDFLRQALMTHSPHTTQIIDRAGHVGPLYRPMFLYHALQIDQTIPDTIVSDWCEPLVGPTRAFTIEAKPISAADGANAVVCAWNALTILLAGVKSARQEWSGLARRFFDRVGRSARHDGSLLHPTSSDNPETQWYHELILSHTLTLHAAHSGEQASLDVALRNAEFQQNETQPDHATSQPWALAAFVLNPGTSPLADQVLHAMQVQHPRGVEGVSLLLLHDALYCLRTLA